MSRLYSSFSHCSIQLFSCIWYLSTMLQISSCHTIIHKSVFVILILTIKLSLMFASVVICWKKLSSPKFLPTLTHTIFTTLFSHLSSNDSTETALLKVFISLLHLVDKDVMSTLALPCFSLSFDGFDDSILSHRLHIDLGFIDTILK